MVYFAYVSYCSVMNKFWYIIINYGISKRLQSEYQTVVILSYCLIFLLRSFIVSYYCQIMNNYYCIRITISVVILTQNNIVSRFFWSCLQFGADQVRFQQEYLRLGFSILAHFHVFSAAKAYSAGDAWYFREVNSESESWQFQPHGFRSNNKFVENVVEIIRFIERTFSGSKLSLFEYLLASRSFFDVILALLQIFSIMQQTHSNSGSIINQSINQQ